LLQGKTESSVKYHSFMARLLTFIRDPDKGQ
jgi:hypothetical protein